LQLNLSGISSGKYDFRFGLKIKDYPVTHNSRKFSLI